MKSLFSVLFIGFISIATISGQEIPEPTHGMNRFLSKNLKYPTEARMNEIQGIVVVQTSFDDSGYPLSSSVISGNPILADEVLETIQELNEEWKSEFLGEKRKSDTYLMSFEFKLSKPKAEIRGMYLGSQKKVEDESNNLTSLESLSGLIETNPYNSQLYIQRAEVYKTLGLPVLAQKDQLLADYFKSKTLTQIVIVGYQSVEKKLGSTE